MVLSIVCNLLSNVVNNIYRSNKQNFTVLTASTRTPLIKLFINCFLCLSFKKLFICMQYGLISKSTRKNVKGYLEIAPVHTFQNCNFALKRWNRSKVWMLGRKDEYDAAALGHTGCCTHCSLPTNPNYLYKILFSILTVNVCF